MLPMTTVTSAGPYFLSTPGELGPHARPELQPKAEARHERTLETVSSSAGTEPGSRTGTVWTGTASGHGTIALAS